MNSSLLRRFFLPAFLFAILFIACDPNDEEGIPSYIQIEQIDLVTLPGQGTASHNITDAWVYIDDKLIGAFELPVTFPVLKTGEQEVVVYAGIKINGISATRAPYPFFDPFIANVRLSQGNTTKIENVLVNYGSNTTFSWMEDFNGGAVSIDTTSASETRLLKISDPELVFSHPGEHNPFSAMASITGDQLRFECATLNNFDLPKDGRPVFLEMHYKNDYNLTVGLMIVLQGQPIQHPILVLNPSVEWNKIYINLTHTLSNFYQSNDFRVFLGFVKSPDTETATIYFDHFKLIH
ncbi:MAG TPA: hypothetical protein ENN08_04555 [Bacteroidales bacterium]|nr:hypothetical protein [Bacteroidales bacterium]